MSTAFIPPPGDRCGMVNSTFLWQGVGMRTRITCLLTMLFIGAALRPASAQDDTLKIFLLLGQSNMEGQAYSYDNQNTAGWNIPTMEFLLSGTPAATNYLNNMPHGFKGSLNASWLTPRDDVWCLHYDSANGNLKNVSPTKGDADIYNGVGPLGPGFGVGTNNGSMFGAELSMGIRLGDSTGSPIFLFKSDKGGTTLGNDWRPPAAVSSRGGSVGVNYTNSLTRFSEFLDGLDADLADDGMLNAYTGATAYEISAVFWFQGWNEKFDDAPYSAAQLQAEYKDNLKDLLYSVRAADARIPGNLGMIVVESSDQDPVLNTARMAAVDELNGEIPSSAVFIDSANTKNVDWGNNELGAPFSSNWGFHFHARAENFLEIGWKAAGAAIDSGFLGEGAALYFGFPRVTDTAFDHADVAAIINDNADQVTVVWDSIDHGNNDVSDWPNRLDLGAWAGGAGEIPATLSPLAEDTGYVYRYFASSAALGTETWSGLGTFTTPFENPPPLFGTSSNTPPSTDGSIVSCKLNRAAATATQVVWAFADQGEADAATWAAAAGGGSFELGAAAVDTVLSHQITGLDASSEYAFRFIASNAFGTVWSDARIFFTARDAGDWALAAYYDFEPDGDPYNDPAGEFADDLLGLFNPAVSADVSAAAKGSTQSASFDGNSALFTDAYSTDLDPDPSAYTIMFWVKGRDIDQENNNTRLMSTRFLPNGSSSGVSSWQIEGFGNNGANGDKMDLRMHGDVFGGGNWFQPDATNALARSDQGETEAVWHHVTFIISNSGNSSDQGDFGRTFVDGVQVGPEYAGPPAGWEGNNLGNPMGQLIIGGHAENAGSRAFSGLLDDVALFAGIVPEAEISALANGLKSPLDYLVEPTRFEITKVRILPNQQIELSWTSEPDAVYTVHWSRDLSRFDADAGDDFASGGDSTTAVFDNPTITPELPDGAPRLYLRVSENP
ncbi:MAG: hypothetical protein ACI9MB_004958 [Verrucomicrobiales bacterium]